MAMFNNQRVSNNHCISLCLQIPGIHTGNQGNYNMMKTNGKKGLTCKKKKGKNWRTKPRDFVILSCSYFFPIGVTMCFQMLSYGFPFFLIIFLFCPIFFEVVEIQHAN